MDQSSLPSNMARFPRLVPLGPLGRLTALTAWSLGPLGPLGLLGRNEHAFLFLQTSNERVLAPRA